MHALDAECRGRPERSIEPLAVQDRLVVLRDHEVDRFIDHGLVLVVSQSASGRELDGQSNNQLVAPRAERGGDALRIPGAVAKYRTCDFRPPTGIGRLVFKPPRRRLGPGNAGTHYAQRSNVRHLPDRPISKERSDWMCPNEFELTVAYEPADAGWFTATIPGMPGVISAGRTKDDARDNVLDGLRTMLATPGSDIRDREVETVHVLLEPTRERHIGRQR